MEGGIEEGCQRVEIAVLEEKDDNGDFSLKVDLNFGYNGCFPNYGKVYGKKVPEGMKEPDVVLSESKLEKEKEKEKERFGIEVGERGM